MWRGARHSRAQSRGTAGRRRQPGVRVAADEPALHRRPTIRRILQTLWYQVNNGQEIYVIGTILDDGTVRGGTGWGADSPSCATSRSTSSTRRRTAGSLDATWKARATRRAITHPHFTGTGTRTMETTASARMKSCSRGRSSRERRGTLARPDTLAYTSVGCRVLRGACRSDVLPADCPARHAHRARTVTRCSRSGASPGSRTNSGPDPFRGLFDANIFYPETRTLAAFGTAVLLHGEGPCGRPCSGPAFSPVAASNMLLLLAFVLNDGPLSMAAGQAPHVRVYALRRVCRGDLRVRAVSIRPLRSSRTPVLLLDAARRAGVASRRLARRAARATSGRQRV